MIWGGLCVCLLRASFRHVGGRLAVGRACSGGKKRGWCWSKQAWLGALFFCGSEEAAVGSVCDTSRCSSCYLDVQMSYLVCNFFSFFSLFPSFFSSCFCSTNHRCSSCYLGNPNLTLFFLFLSPFFAFFFASCSTNRRPSAWISCASARGRSSKSPTSAGWWTRSPSWRPVRPKSPAATPRATGTRRSQSARMSAG